MTARFWPLARGFVVTSPFGARSGGHHWGTDFGRDGGSGGLPVYAAQGGTVVQSGPASGFGRWVVVDHPTDAGSGTTVYGHVVPEVKVGDVVTAGQRIARIDPDSRTNGGVAPHLHFEVHRSVWVPPGPDRLDPLPWLKSATYPGSPGPAPTVPTVPVVNQLQADYMKLSPNDNGTRDLAKVRIAVIHTNEGDPNGSAAALADYLAKPAAQASYTLIVDRAGKIARSNDDVYAPWAAGEPANEIGLHLCFVGRAAQTRAEWLTADKQLDVGARVLADWSKRYSIPLVKLTPNDLLSSRKGVTGHFETAVAWKSTDHHDPGQFFPYDVVLAKAQAILTGTTPPVDGGIVAKTDSQRLKDVREQLAGYDKSGKEAFVGWPQLNNLTVVNALAAIGEKLGIPGFKAPK